MTIVDFIQENMRVLATVCDRSIGGRNFDDVIVEFLAESFQKKTGTYVMSCTAMLRYVMSCHVVSNRVMSSIVLTSTLCVRSQLTSSKSFMLTEETWWMHITE